MNQKGDPIESEVTKAQEEGDVLGLNRTLVGGFHLIAALQLL